MATHELGDVDAVQWRAETVNGGRARQEPAPTETRVPEGPFPVPAQRALTFGILISALRCTLQYIVLPFVLPWIGVTGAIPPWLTLPIFLLALLALARNVRYLWRLHHARRWNYLFLAAVITAALLVFMVVDMHTLLHV